MLKRSQLLSFSQPLSLHDVHIESSDHDLPRMIRTEHAPEASSWDTFHTHQQRAAVGFSPRNGHHATPNHHAHHAHHAHHHAHASPEQTSASHTPQHQHQSQSNSVSPSHQTSGATGTTSMRDIDNLASSLFASTLGGTSATIGTPSHRSGSGHHRHNVYDEYISARTELFERLDDMCGRDGRIRAAALRNTYETLHPDVRSELYSEQGCRMDVEGESLVMHTSSPSASDRQRTTTQERIIESLLADVPIIHGNINNNNQNANNNANNSNTNMKPFLFFDIGVGRGEWSRYLLEHYPNCRGGGLTLWLGSMSAIKHGSAVSPSVYKPFAVLTYAARTNYRYLINYGDVTHPGCMRLHRPELLPVHLRQRVIDECYAAPADLVLCDALLAKTDVLAGAEGHCYGEAREPYAHKAGLARDAHALPVLEAANTTMLLANMRVMLRRVGHGGSVVFHLYHGLMPWSLDILVFLISLFDNAYIYSPSRSALETSIRASLQKSLGILVDYPQAHAQQQDDGRWTYPDLEEDIYLVCNGCRLHEDRLRMLADELFRVNLRGHNTSFVRFLSNDARARTAELRSRLKSFIEDATLDRVRFFRLCMQLLPMCSPAPTTRSGASSLQGTPRAPYLPIPTSMPMSSMGTLPSMLMPPTLQLGQFGQDAGVAVGGAGGQQHLQGRHDPYIAAVHQFHAQQHPHLAAVPFMQPAHHHGHPNLSGSLTVPPHVLQQQHQLQQQQQQGFEEQEKEFEGAGDDFIDDSFIEKEGERIVRRVLSRSNSTFSESSPAPSTINRNQSKFGARVPSGRI